MAVLLLTLTEKVESCDLRRPHGTLGRKEHRMGS